MKPQELYKQVTDNIVHQIEAGNLPPWLLPWKRSKRGGILPRNLLTGAGYQGINILVLWAEREKKGYEQNLWLTYKQCQALGGRVRAGEKAAHIIYANKTVVKDGDDERVVPFLKCFAVFNAAQCDGLSMENSDVDNKELPEHERNERAEAFFAAIGAPTRWGEAMAAYIPSKDCIVMPARGAFHHPENLYATWAHEHVHYTGHKDRLNRDLKPRFDQEAYAFEELVAELGAAMICAELQITGELRHASYVEGWLKVLKKDTKAILTAASLAGKAAEYLRAFSAIELTQVNSGEAA